MRIPVLPTLPTRDCSGIGSMTACGLALLRQPDTSAAPTRHRHLGTSSSRHRADRVERETERERERESRLVRYGLYGTIPYGTIDSPPLPFLRPSLVLPRLLHLLLLHTKEHVFQISTSLRRTNETAAHGQPPTGTREPGWASQRPSVSGAIAACSTLPIQPNPATRYHRVPST